MPTFNVSFLNPKMKGGGGGTGILADQLSILENTLAKDGYLSPGDYDILIKKAREIRNSGDLTADQRSNYDVKISLYERSKAGAQYQKSDDIALMNKALDSEAAEDVMVTGNNPQEFIKGRMASLQAKLNDLSEVIGRREASGDETTDYYNEYNATLQDYRDKSEALESMANFDQKNPIQGFVAYVTTNKSGEIVNVDYGRYGSKSGYAETNGMINGFQVYGKVNYKADGKNYFKLGDKTFTAADMLVQDPNNPGSFKPNKLMADVQDPSGRGLFTKAKAGYINFSGQNIPIQSYLPNDSWAKGVNGTLYHRRPDGGYTKYLNASEDQLPINGPVLSMPDGFEKSLMRGVDETVDASAPIVPDQGMSGAANTDYLASPQSGAPAPEPIKMNYGLPNPFNPEQPAQSSPKKSQAYRTPQQPSAKVDNSVMATAKRTIQSGVQAVKNLFS